MKNLQQQLFPCKKEKQMVINFPFSSAPNDIKCEQSIRAMIKAMETSNVFNHPGTNRGLINPFTKKEEIVGQRHNLINFRSIGQ